MHDEELVEFVRRQLDAEEALANGANEHNLARWSCPITGLVAYNDDEWPLHAGDRDMAEHIALHDPGRVASGCIARRYLLAEILKLDDEPTVDLMLRLLAAPDAWEDDWQPRWEVPNFEDYRLNAAARVVVGEVVQKARELT